MNPTTGVPDLDDYLAVQARVARALYIQDRAPMSRPGEQEYKDAAAQWDKRHAGGNSRVSAEYRSKAAAAIAAYENPLIP